MATLEEKITFYAERGVTQEACVHVDTENPNGRPFTEQEFLEYIKLLEEPESVLARPPEELLEVWAKRIPEYPKNHWQMEMLVKGFEYLKNNGVDIGPDAGALVDAVKAVKDKYPKPE